MDIQSPQCSDVARVQGMRASGKNSIGELERCFIGTEEPWESKRRMSGTNLYIQKYIGS